MLREETIFWKRNEDVLMIWLGDCIMLRNDYHINVGDKEVKERFQLANFSNHRSYDSFNPNTAHISFVEFKRELRSISFMFGEENMWYNQFFSNEQPLDPSITYGKLNSSKVYCPNFLIENQRKRLISPSSQFFIKEIARGDEDLKDSLNNCLNNLFEISYL